MKWNVFDKDGEWLGTVHAANSEAALEKAKNVFHMDTASYVEERDEPIFREGLK